MPTYVILYNIIQLFFEIYKQNKKCYARRFPYIAFLCKIKLLSLDSFGRASRSASAAIDALISVDNVFVISLSDSAYGAFAFA